MLKIMIQLILLFIDFYYVLFVICNLFFVEFHFVKRNLPQADYPLPSKGNPVPPPGDSYTGGNHFISGSSLFDLNTSTGSL